MCTGDGRRTTAGKEIEEQEGGVTVDGMIRDSLQTQTEVEGFMEELEQHGEQSEGGGGPCGNGDGDDECLGCLHIGDEQADEENGADGLCCGRQ